MSSFDREQLARYISLLHLSDSLIELRILAKKGTFSGYFIDRDQLVAEAERWSGRENCYVTLNSAHPDCAARVLHRTEWAGRDATTKDKEIVRRTAILIDFDPVRLSKIASTDAEHEAAVQLAREVREWLRQQGWPEPMLTSSGNGAALYYRLDLPAEDGSLVKRTIVALADRFDTAAVKIDRSVHNAARITRAIGTVNCKGENMPERPHRLAMILDAPEVLVAVTREQLEALVTPMATMAATTPTGDKFDVAGWLTQRGMQYTTESMPDGVRYRLASCPNKGAGHEDGRTWIQQRDDGSMSGGCFHDKCKEVNWPKLRKLIDPQFDTDAERAITGGALEKSADCHRFARVILGDVQHEDGTNTFALEGDILHRWNGLAWQPQTPAELGRFVTRASKAEADRLAKAARLRGLDGFAINVTQNFVGNVRNALQSTVPQTSGQPTWLDGDGAWPADEVLACSDGLIHLPTFAAGKEGYRLRLTPRFFSTLNLGYAFDPSVGQPTAWLEFLDQVWPDDPASILLLQEWLGYLLTLDTSMQKLLVMFGPGGGGKGTILEVARHLIGPANVTSLTLPQLAESHALESLVGKGLCIFPDASIPERMDMVPLVEAIKSITGEDLVSVNPKYKSRFATKLSTRLMIATNDMLDLKDPSGALGRRLLVLRFTRTFTERPDTGLRGRLLAELPGILVWSIEGWRRLREQDRFTESESGQIVKAGLRELGSPIQTFVAECCVVGKDETASKADLFAAWQSWCEENEHEAGHRQSFARLLMSAVPTVKSHRPRVGDGDRLSCYKGVALKDEDCVLDFWMPRTPEEVEDYVQLIFNSFPSVN